MILLDSSILNYEIIEFEPVKYHEKICKALWNDEFIYGIFNVLTCF